MYQANHRVVANGTPLDAGFDNVALAARRAGYDPVLFGYTDQAVDPRTVTDASDPRLASYEGILPGFEAVMPVVDDQRPWLDWLVEQGHARPSSGAEAWETEPDRPAGHSLAAFLTGTAIDWLEHRRIETDRPWLLHLSHLRPHPPFAAAGHFATMYDPSQTEPPITPLPAGERHRLHDSMLRHPLAAAPDDVDEIRWLRAQYAGMVSEVDHQLGRLWAALEQLGCWDDTVVVVTSDHGEYLGDHGLIQKGGCFEPSYHVLGIVRDPRHADQHGTVVDEFTENVDVMPTLCDAMGIAVPTQCDGVPLTPFLRGDDPPWWRDAAHWEYDWRGDLIARTGVSAGPSDDETSASVDAAAWPWDRRLERQHLAVRRDADSAYVHYGNGTWECFDLAADPTWRTRITDPASVLPKAQALLAWRTRHADRRLAGTLIDDGVHGRTPS
jgi:arylsulfatase A-like enzyme